MKQRMNDLISATISKGQHEFDVDYSAANKVLLKIIVQFVLNITLTVCASSCQYTPKTSTRSYL